MKIRDMKNLATSPNHYIRILLNYTLPWPISRYQRINETTTTVPCNLYNQRFITIFYQNRKTTQLLYVYDRLERT